MRVPGLVEAEWTSATRWVPLLRMYAVNVEAMKDERRG